MAAIEKGEVLGGRYEIRELLGEGGMGQVYLAVDRKEDAEVAVKVLPAEACGDPALLRRFEREIESLRRTPHPAILKYLDHGREGDRVYLVTERLRGRTLRQAAGEFKGRAEKVLLLGSELARGFIEAHAKGIVHRDIKPANIMLTDRGEVRILDYGLALWVVPDDRHPHSFPTISHLTASHALLGTTLYMSPEQLRGEKVDRRSDLFSLAVVLYELAGGRRPYDGPTREHLQSAMAANDPAHLDECDPALGDPLGRALDAVLRKALQAAQPQRFHDMEELAEALDKALAVRGGSDEVTLATLLPPPSTLTTRDLATMVGRAEEMALLEDALEAARSGQGAAFVVEGPEGIGKSLLANELVRAAHRKGFVCLSGLVPPASAELGEDPIAVWLRRAHDLFPAAGDVATALELFHAPRTGPPGDEATSDREGARSPRYDRTLAALVGLAARSPLVLFLENIQFASPGVLEIVSSLALVAREWRLLILVTLKSGAASHSTEEALTGMLAQPAWNRVPLGPLGAGDIQQIAEEVYPGLSLGEEAVEQLHQRSGGNPSFALQILGLLEQQGSLRRIGTDWVLEAGESLPVPPGAKALIEQRLAGLEPEDITLLEAAAVLGMEFRVHRLCDLLDMKEQDVDGRFRRQVERRRLIVREGDICRFDHPLTREHLVGRMPVDRRSELHVRAAMTLTAGTAGAPPPQVTSAVVAHLLQGGRADEALPHVMKMALDLREHHAARDAIPWLEQARGILERQAEKSSGPSQGAVREQLAEIEVALGECLHDVGRHAEALDQLDKARALAGETGREDLETRSLLRTSWAFFARGDLLQAARRAADAGRLARGAGLDVECALAISAEAQALSRMDEPEKAESLWIEAASRLEALGLGEEVADLYLRLGNHYFRLERHDQAEQCFAKAAQRVERERNPRLYAKIQNSRAAVILASGRPAEALPKFEEAFAVRRSIGSRRGEATSLHNIAYCHHNLGNLQEARRKYAQVITLRRELGDEVGQASAQRNHAEVLLDLGRIEEALEEAASALAMKKGREDLIYVPPCQNLLGEIELQLGRAQRARESFGVVLRRYTDHPLDTFKASLGLAQAEWMAGQTDAARHRFDAVLEGIPPDLDQLEELAARHRVLRFHQWRHAGPESLQRIAAPVLGDARTDMLPEPELYLAMIRAILETSEGHRTEARRHLREALDIAEALGAVEWSWRLHRDLARLEREGSEAQVSENRQAAEIIQTQATRFRQDELRGAYLAHAERAEILRAAGELPR